MILKHLLNTLLIVIFIACPIDGRTPVRTLTNEIDVSAAENFIRTELYFGRNIPGGEMVSESE